ncbi:MAG: thioredoxin domain-containing protein [Planctomycetota bacterium]
MPNRLENSTSPYLLQHANNPVNWHEWGPEAFAEARERNVPIFLSIGYSTCYWCHVMERESFESDDVAAIMNEHYVCIKADREQLPALDDVYMAATQIMTGRGGWPMSVFLTPDTLKPFYCGTYFPVEPRHGMPSFPQILHGLADAFANRRDEVTAQADKLGEAVTEYLTKQSEPMALGAKQVEDAVATLIQTHDSTDGGFGGAPKFPQPAYLEFLLDVASSADDNTRNAIDRVVTHALNRMAVGGLFDQVGGGFHRYCVDKTWTVPHFEKMLYDNAQLASVYARAAADYSDAFYTTITKRTLDYVLREMTGPEGQFYSAQDAEVAGREGLNYLWTRAEVERVLGDEAPAFAVEVYGLESTNFQDPHHPEDGPKSVLRLEDRPDTLAKARSVSELDFVTQLAAINDTLLKARDNRTPAATDDKALAAWNGMMIVAMLDGAALLGEDTYADAARNAADFVLENMCTGDGALARDAREGKATTPGVLEDHAWMLRACLALHAAGVGEGRYLDAARELAEAIETHFAAGDGSYFDTRDGAHELFVRPRTFYDGASPSGASTLLSAFIAFARVENEGPWLDRAVALARSLSPHIAEQPVAAINATRGLFRLLQTGPAAATALAQGKQAADQSTKPAASPVEIYADTERVTVSKDTPAEINLVVRIAEGHHILAAEPIAEGANLQSDLQDALVPLRVGLVTGQGVAVYADYPAGDPYGEALTGNDDLLVHTGDLELRIAIEHAEGIGPTPGHPILGVTFQVCTDTACLEPTTFELDVAIDIT